MCRLIFPFLMNVLRWQSQVLFSHPREFLSLWTFKSSWYKSNDISLNCFFGHRQVHSFSWKNLSEKSDAFCVTMIYFPAPLAMQIWSMSNETCSFRLTMFILWSFCNSGITLAATEKDEGYNFTIKFPWGEVLMCLGIWRINQFSSDALYP